jgi:hypothetical protein
MQNLIISFFIYMCIVPNILSQNISDTTKNENKITRLFRVDDTFCLVEIEGKEGKIYYEKGEGYTEIRFIKKNDDDKLVWEEYYRGEHTGTIVFYDTQYRIGTFTRHKDNKIFSLEEYDNKK